MREEKVKDGYCKARIPDRTTRFHIGHVNCSRKAVKDGYCRIHHPDAVAARNAATEKRRAVAYENSIGNQYFVVSARARALLCAIDLAQQYLLEDTADGVAQAKQILQGAKDNINSARKAG